MKLITGHPRSGTKFVSTVVQACGYDMPHERIGSMGAVGWIYAGKGYIFNKAVSPSFFEERFHIVRDPVKVVRSMPTITNESWSFLFKNVRKPPFNDPIALGFYTWLKWNELCESICCFRFRVEDFWGEEAENIMHKMGFGVFNWPSYIVNKRINHRKGVQFSLPDIAIQYPKLMSKVKSKAEEYGYDLRLRSVLER